MSLSLSDERKGLIAGRASSVYERAALGTPLSATPAPTDHPAAREALERWAAAFSPGDTSAHRRRLAWDGLDESSALRAITNEPADTAPPDWTRWLDRVAASSREVLAERQRGGRTEPSLLAASTVLPFGELLTALVRAARLELQRRFPPRDPSLVAEGVMTALECRLMTDVCTAAERSLVELCRDATGPGADRGFVDATLRDGFRMCAETFPVLARHLSVILECWVDSTGEFFTRLAVDREVITNAFSGGAELGPLVAIEPGLSDPHHNRRTVWAVSFACGLRVIYKPRDVGIEAAFNQLLIWMANRGLRPEPTELRVIECAGYGWVTCAIQAPLRSHKAAREYWRRAGGLLSLAYILRGHDLHMENVVATADGPVLVDVECLLQPLTTTADRMMPALDGGIIDGALETGLLSIVELLPDGHARDVGGLRGGDGRATQRAPKNAAILDGVRTRPEDFTQEILEGFAGTYRFVLDQREALLAADGPLTRFAACRTRVIPRPTTQYASLLSALAAPAYQRDGVRWSCAMDVLHRPLNNAGNRPSVWPLVVEERDALMRFDIPHFTVRCDGTTVLSDDRPVLDGYFAVSGLTAAIHRIHRLSDDDLWNQCARLRAALAESTRTTFQSALCVSPQLAATRGTGEASLVAAARWIAVELQSRFIETSNPPLHIEVDAHEPATHLRRDARFHLYDGDLGPAILWAALAAVTGDTSWGEQARKASRSLLAATKDGSLESEQMIGVGSGLGSIVYGLSCLGTLLGDEAFIDAACVAARLFSVERIHRSHHFDVVAGSAGALLALLALYRIRRHPWVLDSAIACGHRLVSSQIRVRHGAAWPSPVKRPLLGFAHGTAGITCALSRLLQETDASSMRRTVADARRVLDVTFVPRSTNWPAAVPSEPEVEEDAPSMMAWCHGAPGVVLALIDGLRHEQGGEALANVQTAMETVARRPLAHIDHLCCGNLGRASILFDAGRLLGVVSHTHAGRRLALEVVERARRRRHFGLSGNGFEYRVFTPGFFQGLSGIGYELLRFAAPEQLPSILAFESEPSPAAAIIAAAGRS